MADIQSEHIPGRSNYLLTNVSDLAGTTTNIDQDERILVESGPLTVDCTYSPLTDDVESAKRQIPNTFQYPDEPYQMPGGYC